MNNFQLLKNIVDALPLAVFCKDYSSHPGKFIAWNSSAQKLWGLSKKEAIGKSDYDFFPVDQANFFLKKDLEVLANNDLVFIDEEPISSPNGKKIVRTWKVPLSLTSDSPECILGISLDLTRQKKLEKINRDFEDFAYFAAHELKRPMRNILSLIEIALERKETSNETKFHSLSLAKTSSIQLIQKLDNILEYISETQINLKFITLKELIASQIDFINLPSNLTVDINCDEIIEVRSKSFIELSIRNFITHCIQNTKVASLKVVCRIYKGSINLQMGEQQNCCSMKWSLDNDSTRRKQCLFS